MTLKEFNAQICEYERRMREVAEKNGFNILISHTIYDNHPESGDMYTSCDHNIDNNKDLGFCLSMQNFIAMLDATNE